MPGSDRPTDRQSSMISRQAVARRASIRLAISCGAPTCMGWRYRSCERLYAMCRSMKAGCGNSFCAWQSAKKHEPDPPSRSDHGRRCRGLLAAYGADEEGTLECLKALRHELLDPKIAEHRGPHRQDPRRRLTGLGRL